MKNFDIDLIVTNKNFMQKYRKLLYPDSIDNLNSESGKNSIKLQDLLQTFLFKISIFELKFNFKKLKANLIKNLDDLINFCRIF